jgi:hypothetical protein
VPPLLFVDVNHAQRPEFEALLGFLHRLDRLILEETHFLLTASYYRERLPLIAQLPVRLPHRYPPPFCRIEIETTVELHHARYLKDQLGPNLQIRSSSC